MIGTSALGGKYEGLTGQPEGGTMLRNERIRKYSLVSAISDSNETKHLKFRLERAPNIV